MLRYKEEVDATRISIIFFSCKIDRVNWRIAFQKKTLTHFARKCWIKKEHAQKDFPLFILFYGSQLCY